MLRLWCAKEAAAKALGRGLIGGPQGLLARQLDASTGIVKMVLSGEMARQFPELRDTDLFAYTAREGDLIVASSFCRRIEG
jgi:phosphopantetheinyl transferase